MFAPVLVDDFLKLSAKLYPEKEALICAEQRWTYQAIDKACRRLARALRLIGLGPGERVAIFLDNSAESVISLFSAMRAGGAFIVVNSSVKPRKLEVILRDSAASILVADAARAAVVAEAAKGIEKLKTIWVGDISEVPASFGGRSFLWAEIFQKSDWAPVASHVNAQGERAIDFDLAALIYTSGSTGEPKGVMSSHFNIVSAARSIIEYLQNTAGDKILNVLPLSFDYGLYQVLMAFMFSGTVFVQKSFAFPVKILECIEQERITGFPIVPTIASLLLKMANPSKYDLNSVRYVTNTGGVLPPAHIRGLQKIFPCAKVYSMYGLTECKRVSYLPPEQLDLRPDSVGKPMPNCRAFIVDEKGKEVGPDQIGELVIKGANVMQGYWNSPELTQKTFRPGRVPGEVLLYSGDLFRKDRDGFLYFLARKDEQIKTKGERVSPKEIENIVCELEAVSEAAVIGVPDEILGQAIKCFVVCRPGSKVGHREIINHCSKNMEPFMVPRYVEFLEKMPWNAHGKIDRSLLRTLEADGPVNG